MPLTLGEIQKAKFQRGLNGIICEDPVDIITFAQDPRYLNGPALFPRQGSILKEFFDDGKNYSELVLLWGKGSGKDFIASIAISYMVYRALILPDPQKYYNMAPREPIDFVNVAYNAPQAENVFFKKLKARLTGSPWFRRVEYHTTRNRIEFPKQITAYSMHSQNESYEGFNILGAVMDEAAAFKSTTNVANADKIYSTLRTTIVSRFGSMGKLLILSYPRHVDDFILRMYAESQKYDHILGDKGAT